MATASIPFVSPTISVVDENTFTKIEGERIEHFGGEVSFFFKAEDPDGERVYVSSTVESAKELRDWLNAHLPE